MCPSGGRGPVRSSALGCRNGSTGPPLLERNCWTLRPAVCYPGRCATYSPRSREGGQPVSDAPDPTDLATTQLLPYLAAAGHEEAWRAFLAPHPPRLLRRGPRLQADHAQEVA